uniref:THAP-type domain-containing protein n=1 Tax=Fundulus heteroclitus TaxID=8078 RepID=A0A3Q2QXR2_FUNHE
MVKKCVAYGCSNSNKENVSLHTFPNPKRPGGEKILAEWNRQVRTTRANRVGPLKSHGTYSWNSCVICSDHFTSYSFEVKSSVEMEIGFKTKSLLKPDAVPTIFKRGTHVLSSGSCDMSPASQPHQSDSSSTRRILQLSHWERFFLVSEQNLLSLFTQCPLCQTETDVRQVCQYKRVWQSQPDVGNTKAGNISLSASILFAGLSPAKALRMLNHMNVQNISYATYMNHQTKYLVPSVNDVYKIEHENVIKIYFSLLLGHLAKYGTYTVMEKTTKKIIAAQFVQSNEVGSSTAMEKEGLKRSLEQLSAEGVNIAELVTYRHVSIRKMMRENHPEIRHSVDVWNVVKGELDKLIVQRGCKLIALGSHIINVHTHSDPLLTECQRGELKERKWFLPYSKAYSNLREILFSKNMQKDVKQLTPKSITAGVESFHSLFNHMAPKMLHYHYETFYAR